MLTLESCSIRATVMSQVPEPCKTKDAPASFKVSIFATINSSEKKVFKLNVRFSHNFYIK